MLSHDTLERISSIAEKSEILALGESIHTSDGFYRAKFDIIRHLIQREKVNCILIENSWARTEKINAFFESEASLEEAMSSLYKVWQSKSMAEFLTWLKKKRETGYDLKLAGIDNQNVEEDLSILENEGIDWIRKEITSLVGESGDICKNLHQLLIDLFKRHGNRDKLLDQFYSLADRIASREIQGSLKKHLARISISSHLRDRATFAYAEAEKRDDLSKKALEIRDMAMASIAKQIIKGEKTILWAHNEHIMKNSSIAWSMRTTGECLCDDFIDSYKAVALTAYYCDVNWPGYPEIKAAPIPHPPDSIEERLKNLGMTEKIIDFSNEEDASQFGDCRNMFEDLDVDGLKNHFDAILYFEKSPAMEIYNP